MLRHLHRPTARRDAYALWVERAHGKVSLYGDEAKGLLIDRLSTGPERGSAPVTVRRNKGRVTAPRSRGRACDLAADFWQTALALYAWPNVTALCLALQDRFGFDVMVLLFGCFAGGSGLRLDRLALARLTAAVAPWRAEVLLPLRRRRRAASRPAQQAERKRLLAAEIAAEREEASLIGGWLAARPLRCAAPMATTAAVTANLKVYGALEGSRDGAAVGLARLAALASRYSRAVSASPQRRTSPVSMPKRSSTRPTV